MHSSNKVTLAVIRTILLKGLNYPQGQILGRETMIFFTTVQTILLPQYQPIYLTAAKGRKKTE